MADISTIVNQIMTDGTGRRIASDPRVQFGTPAQPFKGATLLPEMMREENYYQEDQIRYRTVIANSSTRYSPPQKKGNALIGSMKVELAESDIAAEVSAKEYDTIIKLLRANGDPLAIANLTQALDVRGRQPLAILNEQQRWQAIVDAQVVRLGDDNYREAVDYPNPPGHRPTVGGTWSSSVYDPMDDIYAAVELLATKGYTVNRIIGRSKVRTTLKKNANIIKRGSKVTISSGSITNVTGRVSNAELDEIFADDNLPPFEKYDVVYNTQFGSGFFLSDSVLVLVATTGRDQMIDLGDQQVLPLTNTLGYVGIGVPTGQAIPGVRLHMEAFNNKPPRVEVEAWQTALPVIMDPEAIFVLKGIA